MTIKKLHAALSILVREQPDDYIAAEHDEIYVGGYKPDLLSEAEKLELKKLGFFESENCWKCFI